MVWFSRGQLRKRMVIEYCSDMLICANLFGNRDADKRNWEAVRCVSKRGRPTCAMPIRNDVKDSYRRTHHTCMFLHSSVHCVILMILMISKEIKFGQLFETRTDDMLASTFYKCYSHGDPWI